MAAEKAQAKSGAPAKTVKALERGYYDGVIREVGDVFENTLGLKTRGDGPDYDQHAWFVPADSKPQADDIA